MSKPTLAESARTDWANATLIARDDVNDELVILRVRPDDTLFTFRAGQYTVIGLPAGLPRCEGAEPDETPPSDPDKLIRRAYSIASSSRNGEYVELYITLMRSGALTPRVWVLRTGDRLWLGPKAKGHFTMDEVPPDKHVVLIGTGTGLAPYMSMVREHHRCDLGRRFVVVHGARHVRDLGYREELEAVARACPNLIYLPTVSRGIADTEWRGHVGRVQTVFTDGAIEAALGGALSPDFADVFVSGNPEVVEDIQEMLVGEGYTLHGREPGGALHVERYW